jgi:hypothetical protein
VVHMSVIERVTGLGRSARVGLALATIYVV